MKWMKWMKRMASYCLGFPFFMRVTVVTGNLTTHLNGRADYRGGAKENTPPYCLVGEAG